MNPLRVIPTRGLRAVGRRLQSAYRRMFSASALSDLRNPRAWLLNLMAGQETPAGVEISPTTAIEISPVYAALQLVSGHVAGLPLWVYRRRPPVGPMRRRPKEKMPMHPVSRLIHGSFNPQISAFTGRETLTQWAMSMGNGYALIERATPSQLPVALWPIHPSRIRAELDEKDSRQVWYQWQKDDGTTVSLLPDEVLHIRGMGDALSGYSVVSQARRTLGLATATEIYGSRFFSNGAWTSGFLTHPKSLKDDAYKNLKESFDERYSGADNAFRPMILEEGLTWNQATLAPEDAEFLETRKFTVEEIARWFGVPPHKIGHLEKATYSNIEEENISYIQDGLMRWILRWEAEIKRKLFGLRAGNLFAEHTVTAFLRGDQAARAAYYGKMLNIGTLSPNDIRELENMNPIEGRGGDDYYMQSAMTTLDLIADPPEPEPAPAAPPPAPPAEEGEEGAPDADAAFKAGLTETIATAFADALKPEQARTATDSITIRALFEHAAARVVKREASATRGPAKKHADDWPAFVAWAEKFYEGHAAYLEEETRPIFSLCPDQPDVADGWLRVWQDDMTTAACERQREGEPVDQSTATTEMTDFLMRLGRVETT